LEPIKVIIADSNQLIRHGLRSIFQSDSSFEVAGEAENEKELVQHVRNGKFDVITIDFAAPGFSIDSIPSILEINSRAQFVAITGEQSGLTIINALRAGITSYIKKDCDIDEIVDAVRETGGGGKFFCGKILDTIRRESIDTNSLNLAEYSCEPVLLTDRELEVIKLIAEGYTNGQIAEKLFLSSHTVSTHRRNVMHKLGVNNTAAIVMYAVKTELVSPNKFLFSPVN